MINFDFCKLCKLIFSLSIFLFFIIISCTFDKLIIATGSKNRRLPICGLPDDAILYLRNRDDAERIVAKAKASIHIAIIGGGFIGLELAASLTSIGKRITVIEASDRLMSRSIPTEIAFDSYGNVWVAYQSENELGGDSDIMYSPGGIKMLNFQNFSNLELYSWSNFPLPELLM